MWQPGTRVTVSLKDVPQDAANYNSAAPLILFGLMQHEHKKTVLNFAVQRNTEYDGSVRSKVGRFCSGACSRLISLSFRIRSSSVLALGGCELTPSTANIPAAAVRVRTTCISSNGTSAMA